MQRKLYSPLIVNFIALSCLKYVNLENTAKLNCIPKGLDALRRENNMHCLQASKFHINFVPFKTEYTNRERTSCAATQ
jgi:hypothetical protein